MNEFVSSIYCFNPADRLSSFSEVSSLNSSFFPGCVRPYMVQNSWVNLTETNRGLFPVGTVLQYSCDPGYLPNGPSILTCTTSGRWSSEPPQCIRSGGKTLDATFTLATRLSCVSHDFFFGIFKF